MTGWLDPLRAVLDGREQPACFFFRDDDAGEGDAELDALLEVFARHGMPLDVAAIPTLASARTVEVIAKRQADGRNDVRVHQHGFAHLNHEPEGRKCEFGPSRSREVQSGDIARGREVLGDLFGELPPIFTPPWNRCAPSTAEVLHDLGFTVLSRDLSAGRLDVPELAEVPVTVDWFAKRKKVPVDRFGRGRLLAEMAERPEPVGVMLHHAVMSEEDRADVDALLHLVATHPRVTTAHIEDLAGL
jgi:peptidoglycan/xylan/chitin deacetylase (PgdA/CDA1 family)